MSQKQAKATEIQKAVWSYGLITTPGRVETLLPKTLASLAAAGFEDPLIGVDRCSPEDAMRYAGRRFTIHSCHGDNFANWWLTAHEVYLQNPFATHYAMFEDDLVISRGAREYLEATCRSNREYYSLFSWPINESRARPEFRGWNQSDQRGRGAVGLVFLRQVFLTLLAMPGMLHHATDQAVMPHGGIRGREQVDMAIAMSMSRAGVIEMYHSPSIVQHVGDSSESGHGSFEKSKTFAGEEFDLRSLLT